MGCKHVNLGYNNIGHCFAVHVEFFGFSEAKQPHVMLDIVFYAIVNVRNFADVVLAILQPGNEEVQFRF